MCNFFFLKFKISFEYVVCDCFSNRIGIEKMYGLFILILCNEISYDLYNFIIFFFKFEIFYLYKILLWIM